MAEVRTVRKVRHRSGQSSSTESLNSIPVSSDGEAPIVLKEEEKPEKKSHHHHKDKKDKKKKKKKHKEKEKERDRDRDDSTSGDAKSKKKPSVPPRPTRASTIDFESGRSKSKDGDKDFKRADTMHGGGDPGQEQSQSEDEDEKKGQDENEEGQQSKWKSLWQSPIGSVFSATSNAVVTAKNKTVNAAVYAKDTTVNAAVYAKDTTVNAAVTAKDATVNAAVYAKDTTVTAAVTAKDATVNAAVYAKDTTVTAAVTAKDATVNAATYAKDTTVHATVAAKDKTVNAASTAANTTTNTFANVVVLAKKAAKDTKHRMGPAADEMTIVHFNDVYNVESREQEPAGGAARFVTATKKYDHLSPMILFSGDVFAPSIMSTFTKGEQMIPVLNKIGVHCACFGNHDFDFGIDVLKDHVEKTNFPWLISNVIDNETGRPLAEGKITHILDWWGRKIGLLGLVEKEWLDTLATINPTEVTYTDFNTAGAMLAKELREKGCDFVIALTHMRTPNDVKLAENVAEIDLILGGHDHVYEKKMVNGTYILKSGTDFRQFSAITVNFSGEKPEVDIEAVEVTSDISPDNEIKTAMEKYGENMETETIKELGEFQCDLDGRFSSIRTSETNLGNFICDIMVAATNADFALLNSGTLRSDMIHPAGPFFLKDLLTILPMIDPLVLLEVTGDQILQCLENGVSQYPKLEGRFPQVSGISFAFDPKQKPGLRVAVDFVKIGDEYLDKKKIYHMATKAYLADGKDGYECLSDCKKLVDEENGPTLTYAIQNHFKALAMKEGRTKTSSVHHQSLITMSRKIGIVRHLTEDGSHPIPAHFPEKLAGDDLARAQVSAKPHLARISTITDLEDTELKPRIKGRIKVLTPEVYTKLQEKKEREEKGDFSLELEEGEEEEIQNNISKEDLT